MRSRRVLGLVISALEVLVLARPSESYAGASGPSVGNPNVNEASEEPEDRKSMMSGKVASRGSSASRFYAGIEGRHVMNEYYAEDGRRIRRDPAAHGRLQLGVRLYDDRLDLSVAGGAVKMPGTQALYQKRPEIIADYYPIKTQYFNLLWYNMMQFPVRAEDRDPSEFADQDLYEQDSKRGLDASVVTIGFAPVAKYERRMFGGKYMVRVGADAWTRMYSKPLYVDESNEQDGGGVGLVVSEEEPVEGRFEDRAMRYAHQESLAVGWTPAFASALSVDVGAHVESRYIPQYFRDEIGNWQYTYYPERRSFWRGRVGVDISQSTSLHNEIYVFRNGFFAEDRVNDERRYRNVVRLALKL
jgi:hypothetical protein